MSRAMRRGEQPPSDDGTEESTKGISVTLDLVEHLEKAFTPAYSATFVKSHDAMVAQSHALAFRGGQLSIIDYLRKLLENR